MPSTPQLACVAEADFPTEYGHFRILGFQLGEEEAVAVVLGDLKTAERAMFFTLCAAIAGPSWNWRWRPSAPTGADW
jgi:hypothetical protein